MPALSLTFVLSLYAFGLDLFRLKVIRPYSRPFSVASFITDLWLGFPCANVLVRRAHRARRLPHLVPSGPIRVITGPALAWPIIVAHFGSLLHFSCYVRLLGILRDVPKEKKSVADLTIRSASLIISTDLRATLMYRLPNMSCFVSAP